MQTNFRARSVNVHQFSMVPRADVPRSTFRMQTAHKTTFDAGLLIPVYCEEVLPGDQYTLRMTAFCRMSTPIFPIMDNLYLDTFFFYVPSRILWSNWKRFMGERITPDASIDFVVPQIVSPEGGFASLSVYDYFGLPTVGQVVAGRTVSVNALPLRAYRKIFYEWFRDENLVNTSTPPTNDGPDVESGYVLYRRGKRHDYFTSCLPWPQKGNSVTLPLGTEAPVISPNNQSPVFQSSLGGTPAVLTSGVGGGVGFAGGGTGGALQWVNTGLIADLSAATAATVNQLRQSFQIQRLLERDARGGTRYTEVIRSHFGVVSPDARQQRPEYLGGGSTMINMTTVAQTSGTQSSGDPLSTPLATLSGVGTAVANNHGFTQAFTEHGYIIGIVSVRADLTYQQGLRKMWSRRTRYDFYFPVFAHLGEQAVLNKEIYAGTAQDDGVFGYQERWAEYRYHPSMITGLFRSTAPQTLDAWHLSQRFTSLPTLGSTFINENPPMSRVLAVGGGAGGQQFIFDSIFDIKATRPMPLYSVPGLIDHL